jgi:hypothetical protein
LLAVYTLAAVLGLFLPPAAEPSPSCLEQKSARADLGRDEAPPCVRHADARGSLFHGADGLGVAVLPSGHVHFEDVTAIGESGTLPREALASAIRRTPPSRGPPLVSLASV